MSDYMFMLESHLTGEQFRVVGQMQAAAAATGLSLYLTGGAMRDVLGGFPVRDLDFTVEGNPAKLVKAMTQKDGGTVISTDELKKSTQLRFEGGVTAEIAMARSDRISSQARPGQASKVTLMAVRASTGPSPSNAVRALGTVNTQAIAESAPTPAPSATR